MTARRTVPVVAVALLALLATGKPVSAEQVLLRHKFFPPRDMVYDFWASGTATIPASPLPQQKPSGMQVLQPTVNGRLVARIESVNADGNGAVTLQLGWLGMEVTGGERSVHITVDPAQGIMEADGKAIALAELQQVLLWLEVHKLTISPRGKVVAIAAPGPAPIQPQPERPLPLMLRPERWQKLLEAAPAWLPERPVQVGDSWGVNMAIPAPARLGAEPIQVSMRYTLQRIGHIDGNRVARIGFDGGISQTGISVPVPWGGQQEQQAASNLRLILDEALSGQLYFDVDRGQLRSARGDLTVTVRLESAQARQQSQANQRAAGGFQAEFDLHFEVFPGEG